MREREREREGYWEITGDYKSGCNGLFSVKI